MIGFYVIMIAVLAMSATAGYTIFTSASTGSALSLAHQNSARIEQNMSALNFVVAINSEGNFAVPIGIPENPSDPTSRMVLPEWVSASAATPWGVSYGYCPYAPADWSGPAGTPTDVHDSEGLSHIVSVSNEIVSQGMPRSYVTSGDARAAHASDAAGAPDVLAFLISPSNNKTAIPACDDVYWTGQGWAVEGAVNGSVRALTPDALTHSMSEAPRLLHRYVTPDGAGTGMSSTNPTSLEMALAEWTHLAPSRMTIRLSGSLDNHEIDLATADLGSGPGNVVPNADSQGRSLHLVGESGAIVAASDGPGDLAVPVDMTISGVDFASSIGLEVGPGVRLVLRDGASVPSLRSRGGHVVMSSGASILAQGAGSPLVLEGGSMTLQGNTTIDASGAGAAAIHLDGAGFRLDGSLGVVTDAGLDLFTAGSRGMPSYGPAAGLTLNEVTQDLTNAPDILASSIEAQALTAGTSELETASVGALTSESLETEQLILGLEERSKLCADNSMECFAVCTGGRRVVSGSCSAGGTNVFLTGASAASDGTRFTCNWSAAQGTNLSPSSLIAPTATALCAPID